MNHMILHKATEALIEAIDSASDEVCSRANAEEAAEVIKKCAVGAAIAGVGSGWLPGAGGLVATAAWVAAIWTMYALINKKLGISVKENVLKSLASAILTNILAAAGAYLLAMIAGGILSFIPGIGTAAAMAVDAMLGYVTVFVSGILYLNLLTMMYEKYGNANFDGKDLKGLAKSVTANANIKSMMDEAKASYKEDKKAGKLNKK